jgi:hypothetical protein
VGVKGGSHGAGGSFFPLQSLSRQQRPRRKYQERRHRQPIGSGLGDVTNGRSLPRGRGRKGRAGRLLGVGGSGAQVGRWRAREREVLILPSRTPKSGKLTFFRASGKVEALSPHLRSRGTRTSLVL